MLRIFLAHASEDNKAVIDLYNRLKESGFDPWLDKKDLRAGQNWRSAIPKAIKESDVFIACLSKQSVAKQGYIQREFRMALTAMADRPPGQIFLIPVRLDDCEIPELRQEEYGISLSDYQWVNLFEPDGYERLVKDIEYGFADVLRRKTSGSEPPGGVPTSVIGLESSADSSPSNNDRYEEVLARVRQLEDELRASSSSPKYDLRGAQFAGGFAETVSGAQVGGTINNETFEESSSEASQYLQKSHFIDLGNGVCLELIRIPGGTFQMGAPVTEVDSEDRERPVHRVTVADFWMGKYPVTQAQYEAVTGKNPSQFKGEDLPVESVTWGDALEFCNRLSSHYLDNGYRLPSEAEWEYACRARTTTPFYFGETISPDEANYDGNDVYGDGKKGIYRKKTTPVGIFSSNQFGLYDMHGNVYERCQDYWHKNYVGAPPDGSVWDTGGGKKNRVIRGGAWGSNPRNCRSAFRYYDEIEIRDFTIGFRICCSVPSIPQ